MLKNYYNAAILNLQREINGVDKLERLPDETLEEYNRRRRAYIAKKKREKRKDSNGTSKSKRPRS